MNKIIQDSNFPVYVLTTQYRGNQAGCVITWLMPASLNQHPKKICMVVSKFSATLDLLKKNYKFSLNLLAPGQISEFFIFGTQSSRQFDKFDSFEWSESAFGLRLDGVAGVAEGIVDQIFETPDRVLVYGSILHEESYKTQSLTLQSALEGLSSGQQKVLQQKMQHDSVRDEFQFTSSQMFVYS